MPTSQCTVNWSQCIHSKLLSSTIASLLFCRVCVAKTKEDAAEMQYNDRIESMWEKKRDEAHIFASHWAALIWQTYNEGKEDISLSPSWLPLPQVASSRALPQLNSSMDIVGWKKKTITMQFNASYLHWAILLLSILLFDQPFTLYLFDSPTSLPSSSSSSHCLSRANLHYKPSASTLMPSQLFIALLVLSQEQKKNNRQSHLHLRQAICQLAVPCYYSFGLRVRVLLLTSNRRWAGTQFDRQASSFLEIFSFFYPLISYNLLLTRPSILLSI